MSHPSRHEDDPFLVHRGLLFTVAYELLGSAADAEDVLQESWLRWAAVDQAEVREPRAYLVRIVTRQALNQLRTVARRREEYVGPWLPEPLLTGPDVAADIELAESLSIAMLTVLETLGPAERAVFVLREVFDVPYDEIADAVGKSPAAVRQIAHRAKAHVSARQPRMRVVAAEHEEVVERFVRALNTGDLQALMDVLAPDVASVADSGGKVRGAARGPIVGAQRLARYLTGNLAKVEGTLTASTARVNGQAALRVELDGQLMAVVTFTVEHGLITRMYTIANPDKLGRLDEEASLSR
ncbi:RNA polymerase sigma-70 factor [Microbacterium sp. zg.B48]|uniref:RNA polymerase sigma-70 factor n=1 Tax=unclassified Microbacterium TaxID=2609290 RepID=UPI00214A9B39|nr:MULTISPECIES: RNA polymerase sigma-70 factor [unclassified Microbacterium]MCR2763554.1 RNA polymerase sigma-70 factor [Microbacterium sp. zg.B48]MCR2809276.1 RNA polymerase sigma-70 factor [Microbacterium sp. zg.B185]WIM20419.1 RNA polymerase sigma-70 factor [Microbacterium sp. zg-B185]